MLRLAWRAAFFGFYTAKIVLEIILKTRFLPGFRVREAMAVRQRWAGRLLQTVGVRMQVEGSPPDFPCLLVCNHRSYLDPIAILCHVPGMPVSKAEVRHWPALGYGAALSGIIYLQREDAGSRITTLKAIAAAIRAGHPVILFPEGTTSDLAGTLPFKRSAFQIAARFGFPVVPAAIHFDDPADFWIGTDTFGSHASRSFRKKHIRLRLRYGAPIASDDPEELLRSARQWIENQLLAMRRPD